ncbi:hydrogenase nickel incorporation protein HypB [Nocardia amikacinitolerans]|uniref:hydrogenase nickel incorporation protein HypB n=1 Tax=Nocardia amikacinitolerans TaxID=756689 RepID=UPI000832E415|nr:hydrogenase nickel incorporation protein HypB [Nocardia amikacinitolerans]
MCATCGCGDSTAMITVLRDHPHEHDPDHRNDPDHQHAHGHHHGHEDDDAHGHEHADHVHVPITETVTLEQKVLAKNDRLAQHNRERLRRGGIVALNVTSSPGAGKTTLLERTIRDLSDRPVAVVEGDQETLIDAQRIKATGCRVVQVNTGAGCHLDAEMMRHALDELDPAPGTLLFIENVGNLVCPALFDLGELAKVVVFSVTEGTDKPLKYPHMFAAAGLVIVNKIDLIPYVDFDLDRCAEYAHSINPGVPIMPVSAITGEGLPNWYTWLSGQMSPPSASLEEASAPA